MKNALFALIVLLLATVAALATQGTERPAAARPGDVESPDALLAAVYDVISGPAGQERDWDRFRSLFAPDARLASIRSQAGQDGAALTTMTPDEYIERSGAWLVDNGFFEVEVARKTDRFGHLVQAFSTYEGRRSPDDAEPFLRGINSFQLVHDGERWWVHSILWEAAHAELAIPAAYRAR